MSVPRLNTLRVCVEGIGLWSPQLASFDALKTLLAGGTPEPPPPRPAATTLPPNERRRAPESVLLAVEVAGQAVAMSGRTAATLACVFASSQGDQQITDYMCATLAKAPNELSPTRFHNSVHNAPAGYWTIATDCQAPSTAVCAQRASFGAGLLEAASQVLAEQRPVLLVCSDTSGSGPMLEVTGCTLSLGCALVLAPEVSATTLARLALTLTPNHATVSLPQPLADWREANASGDAWSLLALLARGHGRCQVDAVATLGLQIDLEGVA
jgi:hypothetical protein